MIWRLVLRFNVLALAASLLACQSTPVPRLSDLERTWAFALVVLPPESGGQPVVARMRDPGIASRLNQVETGPRPAVLYAHGCTGIGNVDFLQTLAAQGFIVIAPDSFVRLHRPLQCDPENQTGGYNPFIYEFRLAEIAYAAEQLLALGGVDPRRLYMIGTSEGAVAVALYRGDEFSGRVIAQWTCHGAPVIAGLAAPADEPILAVVHKGDPWYGPARTAAQTGHCGDFMAGRPKSRSIVLDGEDTHFVYRDPAILDAVLTFLSEN